MLAGLAASGCGRSPEDQAAERAQEACLETLEPVARDRRPSPEAVSTAVRHADDAARVDRRWVPLRARVRDFQARLNDDPGDQAVSALVRECERVSEIVKQERDDV